jgi:ParB-like chromosome segregation protein Spo0J
MKIKQAKIDTLLNDPANARSHDQRNIDAIKSSLEKFGQQKPIVVNADGVVVAGNGTLVAAKDLGWDKISIVETELDGVDATAYAVADNRTAELAAWDDVALGKLLSELREESENLIVGFTDDEIDILITPKISGVGATEISADDFSRFDNKCKNCGFEFDD